MRLLLLAMRLAVLPLLFGFAAHADAQKTLPLPGSEAIESPWRARAFPRPETGRSVHDCARFRVADDPEKGRCLVVGSWVAGRFSARVEYEKAFEPKPMEVRGWYRTEGLSLPGACVRCFYWNAQGKRPGGFSASLGPAAAWKPFSVRIDKFPAGTTQVRLAFGLSFHTSGRVWFTQLSVQPLTGAHPLADLAEPTITRSAPPPQQKGTGFYRVGQFGEAWWLLDPAGRPFYSLATDGSNIASPGPNRPDAEAFVKQLREWGFNSLAGWTNPRCWGPYNRRKAASGKAVLDWSWPQAVPTQDMRAKQAAHVAAAYYNLPFMVGAHWFTWRDFDSPKREANRGLVRSEGTPWRELTQALTDVHRGITRHMGGAGTR